MLQLIERINAFNTLQAFIKQQCDAVSHNESCELTETIRLSEQNNPWFTKVNVICALEAIQGMLRKEDLQNWTKNIKTNNSPKKIGVVLAGNIPLVGFHDILACLISGHQLMCKMSSKDTVLTKWLLDKLCLIEPSMKANIIYADNKMNGFDAIIATGSDNSSRYFDYYFAKYPNIIRKNRSSIAILKGDEDEKTIKKLADDIFMYFGLGCRSISKLYVHKSFDITKLFPYFEEYASLINHNKYANNYHYNRTMFLMNNKKHLDNGFMLLCNDKAIHSPISVVNYDYYNSEEELQNELLEHTDKLQCVATNSDAFDKIEGIVPIGKCQQPQLEDYADRINTLNFLNNL